LTDFVHLEYKGCSEDHGKHGNVAETIIFPLPLQSMDVL